MAKLPKWRVGICSVKHWLVEVEASTPESAKMVARNEIKVDPEYFLVSSNIHTSSLLINDKASRGFAPYVHDSYPTDEKNK